jgi:hypothetical protein
VDCVHWNADDRASWEILVIDRDAAWKNDTGKMAWHGCSAAKRLLNAGVKIVTGVELSATEDLSRRAEGRAMRV